MTIVRYQPHDGRDGIAIEDGAMVAYANAQPVARVPLATSQPVESLLARNLVPHLAPRLAFCHTTPRQLQVEVVCAEDFDRYSEETWGELIIRGDGDERRVPWAAHLAADPRFMARPDDDGRARPDGRGWVLNLADIYHDAYLDWRLRDVVEVVLADVSAGRERPLPARFQLSNVFGSTDLPASCALPLTVADAPA